MSLADFDDIYRICCDFDLPEQFDSAEKFRINRLSADSDTDPLLSHSSRWWEVAEKEILQEKNKSLYEKLF